MLTENRHYLYRRFLIKREELHVISAYIYREKQSLRILQSRFYFWDSFQLYETITGISACGFKFSRLDTAQQNREIQYPRKIRNLQYVSTSIYLYIITWSQTTVMYSYFVISYIIYQPINQVWVSWEQVFLSFTYHLW